MGSDRSSARDYNILNAMARGLFSEPRVIQRHTNHPDVFKYAAYNEGDGKLIYGLQFYGGLDV